MKSEIHPQPRSLSDLFVSFTVLGLQGFGGVLAVVQREMVERKRWLTREEFVEEWAVVHIMPGPNVVNLALMIGGRYFGLAGAMSALAGMLCIPLALVLLEVDEHFYEPGLKLIYHSLAQDNLKPWQG